MSGDPRGVDLTKGWFVIPGQRNGKGDRTVREQMMGLEHALKEAQGKTVLDLGCAEGMITIEFAKAGASKLIGLEALEHHLSVARELAKPYPIQFVRKMIEDCSAQEFEQHDIVLALSVLHKLRDCEQGLRNAAGWSRDLLVIRYPQWHDRKHNRLVSKRHLTGVDVNATMKELGFQRERTMDGPPRHEPLEYWRRVK